MADIFNLDDFRDGQDSNPKVTDSYQSYKLEGYENMFQSLTTKERKIGGRAIVVLNKLCVLSRACMNEFRVLFNEEYAETISTGDITSIKPKLDEIRAWDVLITKMIKSITLMNTDEYMKNFGKMFSDFHMIEIVKRNKCGSHDKERKNLLVLIEKAKLNMEFLEKYGVEETLFEEFIFVLNLLENEI